jgi:hypothetical protein
MHTSAICNLLIEIKRVILSYEFSTSRLRTGVKSNERYEPSIGAGRADLRPLACLA